MGIKHKEIAAYQKYQAGTVEQFNNTIIRMIGSCIEDFDDDIVLDYAQCYFWGEVVNKQTFERL